MGQGRLLQHVHASETHSMVTLNPPFNITICYFVLYHLNLGVKTILVQSLQFQCLLLDSGLHVGLSSEKRYHNNGLTQNELIVTSLATSKYLLLLATRSGTVSFEF